MAPPHGPDESTALGATLPASATEVPRISNPTAADFLDGFVKVGRPVVLEGATAAWCERFSFDALGKYSDRTILVEPPGAYPRQDLTRVSLGAYLDQLRGTTPTHMAMRTRNLLACFPEFGPAFEAAPLHRLWTTRKDLMVTMWISPARTHTPLHFDMVDNLNAQIEGRKTFILFSPQDSRHLSVRGLGWSPINPLQPDRNVHPRFHYARPMMTVLQPGETLYIPFSWWHWVRAETNTINITSAAVLRGGRQQLRKWRLARGHPVPLRLAIALLATSERNQARCMRLYAKFLKGRPPQ